MAAANRNQQKKITEIVLKTIFKHRMLKKGDAVLVGVSGGPDSMALFHMMYRLVPMFGIHLGVAHLNHGIRGVDSDQDADFVKKTADHFGIRCHIEKIDVPEFREKNKKLSLEQAARQVRYSFFNRISNRYNYNRIALGHHRDDNAEMVLMALLRGSGPLGLAGIPPIRDQKFIRPLIRLSREDIMAYLAEKGIQYRTDFSNEDSAYLRNDIRHRLLPLLSSEYNPKMGESLARLAEILRTEDEWIRQMVDPFFQSSIVNFKKNVLTLSNSVINQYHPALRRRILRMALELIKGDLKEIRFRHVDDLVAMAGNGAEIKRLDLPGRILVLCDGKQLKISKESQPLRHIKVNRSPDASAEFAYHIHGPGSVKIKETKTCLEFLEVGVEKIGRIGSAGQHVAFFDIQKINYPLVLRNYNPNDRFRPLGMKGSKTVVRFLKDRKVPFGIRNKPPVLLSGEKIAWVVGFQIDDDFKVTAATEKILKVTHYPCLSDKDD